MAENYNTGTYRIRVGRDYVPEFWQQPRRSSLIFEYCKISPERFTCSAPLSVLHLAASAAALPAVSRITRAQSYPSRPVKIIVGQAAGSASDLIARLIAQFLSEKLGQQFLVEVRPGAAGNIATEAVTR